MQNKVVFKNLKAFKHLSAQLTYRKSAFKINKFFQTTFKFVHFERREKMKEKFV